MNRADWMTEAACATRPGLPWTSDTAAMHPIAVEVMQAVCAGCPVLAQCGSFADRTGVVGGWWAGTDRDPDLLAPGQLPLFGDAA